MFQLCGLHWLNRPFSWNSFSRAPNVFTIWSSIETRVKGTINVVPGSKHKTKRVNSYLIKLTRPLLLHREGRRKLFVWPRYYHNTLVKSWRKPPGGPWPIPAVIYLQFVALVCFPFFANLQSFKYLINKIRQPPLIENNTHKRYFRIFVIVYIRWQYHSLLHDTKITFSIELEKDGKLNILYSTKSKLNNVYFLRLLHNLYAPAYRFNNL